MARNRRHNRQAGLDSGASRSAKVGELIRRVVAESIDDFDDERLDMVSVTGCDVDRDLHRAVIWYTTLDRDDDPEVVEAFEEYRGPMRHAVSQQTRLRRAPELDFRLDVALRSAERIEELLRSDVPSAEGDGGGQAD